MIGSHGNGRKLRHFARSSDARLTSGWHQSPGCVRRIPASGKDLSGKESYGLTVRTAGLESSSARTIGPSAGDGLDLR